MRILVLAFVLTALPITNPAWAQAEAAPTPSQRAMAAGYKALTVCSAIFNAGAAGGERTLASVEANELVGIYPELDVLVRDMPVEIGPLSVTSAWDDALPPRVAVYEPHQGCKIMPVGWVYDEGSPVVAVHPPQNLSFEAGDPVGNAALLNEAVEQAFESGYGEGVNTTAVLVVQDDRIVAEEYADGFGVDTPQRTWSVAKSLAGTLVGAAVQRGEADVNAAAAIANWRVEGDPRGAITLDNLMRMASGLTSDTAGNRTDAIYFGGVTVAEQAPTWPLIAPPGSRFRYANNDILLAVLSLSPTLAAHSPGDLFAQLGMADTVAETDWRGNYILSSQVWSTARDLARFGLLYVHDGMQDGRRILPEGWRDYVSRPSGPQPPTGAFGYGATFWLMNRSEGVPADTIAAFGNRGQYVVIVPGRKIVIVRRGEDPAGKTFDIAAFARDVLAALD